MRVSASAAAIRASAAPRESPRAATLAINGS